MKQADLFPETATATDISEKDKDVQKCHYCKKTLPHTKFDINPTAASNRDHRCKECKRTYTRGLRRLKKAMKYVSSKASRCEICGINSSERMIVLDHCHSSERFRGWLCTKCNKGIGQLGDNIEGLRKAMLYLYRSEEEDETHT